MRRSVIPIFVPHLGCPNMCVFCNQKKISGHTGRPSVVPEITQALERIEPAEVKPQIAFYGGSFTAIPISEQTELLEQALPFVLSGRACSLRVSTRPDCIDKTVVERLKKYRVETVELGAQSMDDGVLRLSKRGHSAADTEKAARLLKREGFELVLQMMTGLPGDSGDESLETARKLIALEPDAVRIYPTAVLPDTELASLWQAGDYTPQSVESAVELCAKLLDMFFKAGIPVIRLGLNPSKELDESVLAGAYHPALGDMAAARLYLSRALELLRGVPKGSVTLGVAKNRVGTMVGYKRQNAEKLHTLGYDIKVKPAEVGDFEVILL